MDTEQEESILDLIMQVIGSREAERNKEHTHCCGFSLDGKETVSGCGHKWTHRMSDFNSQEAYDHGHVCPKCGAGPWRWQLDDVTLKEHDRRKHERATK